MYLKVEESTKEPVLYLLDKSDITVGSAATNHLILAHRSISKKHLRLTCENNEWFAVDQGSTNGSYLDDEQLVPGKRFPLKEGDTIRLGSQIEVTLTNDGENAIPLPGPKIAPPVEDASAKNTSTENLENKTRVISLDDLKKAKVLADQKKKKELQEKKARELKKKKEEQKRLFKIFVACLVIIAAGFIGNKVWKSRVKQVKKDTIINRMKTKHKGDEEIETDLQGFRISRKTLMNRNKLAGMIPQTKCLQEETSGFCVGSETLRMKHNGAIFQKPATYIFFVEEKEWLQRSHFLFEEPDKAPKDQVQKVAFMMVADVILADVMPEDSSYYIVFYEEDENKVSTIKGIWAAKSSSAKYVTEEFSEEGVTGSAQKMKAMLDKLEPYFTVY